jgi:hypothetical protein
MDTRPVDYLRHRMARFSLAIEETRSHFSELSALGRFPASAPYYERSGILQLFDSLDPEGEDHATLMQEFQQIGRDLIRLEEEQKSVYRHLLREELSTCLDACSAAVCHANLGGVTAGSRHDIFCRNRISVLIHELEKDHDLTDAKNLLRTLDASLLSLDTDTERVLSGNSIPAAGDIRLHSTKDRIEG